MNWDDLRFVLAIVREGTLLGAAKRLSVTHTTVSRRLRSCEEDLGVALFDRTPDGLVATSAGQRVFKLAESTEEQVMRTEAQILGTDLRLEGTLRVSTFDALYAVCHSAFLSFRERYPHIELTITTASNLVSLNRREADVALRLTSDPPPGLVGRRIGQLHFAVFGSHELVSEIGEDAGLGDYPWIGIDTQLADAAAQDSWIKSHGGTIVMRTDENAFVVRHLIQSGVGVCMLPIDEGEALGLRRIEHESDASVPVWMLTLPDLRRNSRVRAFLDHMGEALPQLLSHNDMGEDAMAFQDAKASATKT